MEKRLPFPEFGHGRKHKHRRLPLHRNAGLEVVVVERGRLTWQVDGVTESVGPGSAFFTLPWQMHGGIEPTQPGWGLSYVVLSLADLNPHSPERLRFHAQLGLGLTRAEERAVFTTLCAARRHAAPATARLRAALPALVDELSDDAVDRRAQRVALTMQVILELVRSVTAAGEASPTDRRVRTFLDTLAENCHQPWTLIGMARRCGLRRTRFAHLVERETGDSPITHVLRLRVRRMQRLLRETTQPITRIALDCGFSSSQYAARVFKAFAGCTAAQWRG